MQLVRLSLIPSRKATGELEQPLEQVVKFQLEFFEQVGNHGLIHALVKATEPFFDLLGQRVLLKLSYTTAFSLEHALDLHLDSMLPLMQDERVESRGHGLIRLNEDQVRPRVLLNSLVDVFRLFKFLLL